MLLYAAWPVVPVDVPLIVAATLLIVAATLSHEHDRISFWDTLVVEAALRSGSTRLASEDLQAGRRFDALEMVNPLA